MKKEDRYIDVEIEMDDDTFLKVAKSSHEADITFNQMIQEILRERLFSDQELQDME